MEKRLIKTHISGEIHIETHIFKPDIDIQSVIDDLIRFQKESATHLSVDAEWDMHDSLESVTLHPLKVTLESDEDFKKRVEEIEKKEANRKKREEVEEKELFEQLKKKYNKD